MQSTPVYLPPAPEILAPEVAAVQEYHENLQQASKALKISTMRIAYFGHRMRMSQGWVAYGYEEGPRGEEAYRTALEIPRSSWYRACRIGQALHQLPLADLERIPVTNAEILLSVDPILWHDHPWAHEARTLDSDRLAALVTSRNKSIGSDQEPLVTMAFRVPMLARKAIDRMLDVFVRQHELSSKSQAIEMLIAEKYDRTNLIASVEKARRLIEGAYHKMKLSAPKRIKLQDELTWLSMAMEVLDEAREKAIQAAREEKTGCSQTGRRAGDM